MSTPVASRAVPPVVWAALGVQTLLAAGTHLAAKRATLSFPPLPLVSLRLALAAVVFVVVLAVTPGPRVPPRRLWGWLVLFGFIAGPANQGLFMYGLTHSRATHGGLLYALTPLGVYALAVLTGRERAHPRRVLGIVVAVSGVVVLLLGQGLSEAMAPLLGDVFILAAVVAWVLWTTESRQVAAEHGGLRTAAWGMIAGGVWALPVLPFAVDPGQLASVDLTGWLCLGYLVVLASVAGYALWNFALARVEASRVAVVANLQPLATGLLAWLILDEALHPGTLAGGALVIAGVWLAQRR